MSRGNQSWVAELKAGGESVIADLRAVLLRNLRKALANQLRADHSFLEDAAQDSVMRVIDRVDQFAGRSQFVTWATSIAIRIALAELRRSRWKDVSLHELIADSHFALEVTDSATSPYERQAILETLQHGIVHDLTDRQPNGIASRIEGHATARDC